MCRGAQEAKTPQGKTIKMGRNTAENALEGRKERVKLLPMRMPLSWSGGHEIRADRSEKTRRVAKCGNIFLFGNSKNLGKGLKVLDAMD
jgi:hypothetical protein